MRAANSASVAVIERWKPALKTQVEYVPFLFQRKLDGSELSPFIQPEFLAGPVANVLYASLFPIYRPLHSHHILSRFNGRRSS